MTTDGEDFLASGVGTTGDEDFLVSGAVITGDEDFLVSGAVITGDEDFLAGVTGTPTIGEDVLAPALVFGDTDFGLGFFL